MHTITIWSDLSCPWSYVACLRLHKMRDHLDADEVEFDFRARPREFHDEHALDMARISSEVTALAQHEHTAFSAFSGRSWPSTIIPAFEAQKWAYSLGQDTGERFDLALRRAMFLHSHDLSHRDELLAIAEAEGLASTSLADALDRGTFRASVHDDHEASKDLDLDGTPVVILPDGIAHQNPGITVQWIRGLPVISADHPSVYEEIIRSAATAD